MGKSYSWQLGVTGRRCRIRSTHLLELLAEILTSIYLMCFSFVNCCVGKKLQLLGIHFVFLWNVYSKPKRLDEQVVDGGATQEGFEDEEKSVVVVEETRALSPVLSLFDVARKKLEGLMAADEVSESKRLKEKAILGYWTAMSHGIDPPFGIIGRNAYFNLFDVFFFCKFLCGKKLQLLVIHFVAANVVHWTAMSHGVDSPIGIGMYWLKDLPQFI